MAVITFIIWIAFAFLVGSMAKKRGRSFAGWFLFSLVLSPVIGIIFVLICGETDENRLKRIEEEEELRAKIRAKANKSENE